MDSSILFISDIHYSIEEDISQLKINDDNGYYKKWENYLLSIKMDMKIEINYLVITGDLVQHGKSSEYEGIKEILEKLCQTLCIDKKNILIIPGNHDINRAKLEDYCDTNKVDNNKAHKHHNIKLENFIKFYNDFLPDKVFDPSTVIIDSIEIENSGIEIVGVNSLYKESHLEKDHYGYIEINDLSNEFDKYKQNENKVIFIATHHSLANIGNRELATLRNAELVKETLKNYKINTYIYGHHHTSESKLDNVGDQEEIYRYLEIGSLGKILSNKNGESYTNRFSIAIYHDKQLELHDYAYSANEWNEINSKKYIHKLKIENVLNYEGIAKPEELPRVSESEIKYNEQKKQKEDVIIYGDSNFLVSQLKNDNYYKEGHFHWKDGKKTLGWINIAAFLGDINILHNIKDCIMQMHKEEFKDIQAVVGYGMEGNIIGSSLMDYWIEKDIVYHFYPSVHKEGEHTNIEKSLWNEFSDLKKILLVCDMMPSNLYLNEIIMSSDELSKCSDVYILSLFYNVNLQLDDIEFEAVSPIRIKRLSLAEFSVRICEEDIEKCIIYEKSLKKVYNL